MNSLTEAAVTIALMIGGIALASVLVSRNANTTGIIQAGASGLGNDIAVAQSPVTGAMPNINLNYPNSAEASVFGS
jgi:PRD1 phage membrane DNA delivery